jgi:DNA-binding NarL/FixJ family response regulator
LFSFVDDNEGVLQELRSLLLLQSEWQVCGEGRDGLEAVEKARSLRPDIALIDISMPRMSGVEGNANHPAGGP